MRLRHVWISTVVSFAAVTSVAAAAYADVAPSCKCSTLGMVEQSGLAGIMAAAGAILLLAGRIRGRSR